LGVLVLDAQVLGPVGRFVQLEEGQGGEQLHAVLTGERAQQVHSSEVVQRDL
jgi:hypothetical protein